MGGVTGCFHPSLNPLLPPPASGGGIRKGIITALPSREGRFWFDTLQLTAGFFILLYILMTGSLLDIFEILSIFTQDPE